MTKILTTSAVASLGLLLFAAAAHADTYIGHVQLPVSFNGTVNTEENFPAKGQIYINWDDYLPLVPGGHFLYGKLCFSYTDSGSGTDQLNFALIGVTGTNTTPGEVMAATLPNTWSGEGLYHHACGPTEIIVTPSCGSGWANACKIMMWTNGRTFPLIIDSAEIELYAR